MISNFISKLLIYCALFCLINIPISILIYNSLDVASRTEQMHFIKKLQSFKKQENELDAIFIGSSRVFHGIDTNLFSKNTGLKSYNLGLTSFFPPKTLILLENLFDTIKATKIKHIFFELNRPVLIRKNFKSEAAYYNANFLYEFDIIFLWKYHNLEMIKHAYLAASRKFFTVTKILLMKKHKAGSLKHFSKRLGYEPLSSGNHGKGLQKRRDNFLQNNLKININEIEPQHKLNPDNSLFFNHFHKTLKRYRDLGIEIIFFNTPGSSLTDTKKTYSIFLEKNSYPFIEINSSRYPDLFKKELFYDVHHLNKNGAEMFTEILSRKYLQLNNRVDNKDMNQLNKRVNSSAF